MRAFFLSGQKIRYDGIGPHGTHQYCVVSGREYDAIRKLATTPRFTPGSFIDFHITPTLTALSPLAAALSCDSQRSGFGDELATVPLSLDTEGFLDVLSTDFSRSLKDFALVMSDLRRLSALGAIPITEEKSGTLRVRFPGVDALTLETLCDDLCIQRGIIGQDAGLDDALGGAVALRFPFAPASEQAISSPGGTLRSLKGIESDEEESLFDEVSFVHEAFDYKMADEILWLSEDDGRTSLSPPNSLERQHTEDFEGLQGIHRFLEACDRAKGRVG